jgi:hypothetical protein
MPRPGSGEHVKDVFSKVARYFFKLARVIHKFHRNRLTPFLSASFTHIPAQPPVRGLFSEGVGTAVLSFAKEKHYHAPEAFLPAFLALPLILHHYLISLQRKNMFFGCYACWRYPIPGLIRRFAWGEREDLAEKTGGGYHDPAIEGEN